MLRGVAEGLLELARAGREAWPKLAWPAAEFAQELERRGLVDVAPGRIADVDLARACARAHPAALAALPEQDGKDPGSHAPQARPPPGLAAHAADEGRPRRLVRG